MSAIIPSAPIDVVGWQADERYAHFPVGSRPKLALFPPDDRPFEFIERGRRYLFKLSSSRAPDQYWSEVVAYFVGVQLGVRVPPAFAAFDSSSGVPGSLIEWFYLDSDEYTYVAGGDFLQRLDPEFEREKGTDHTLPLVVRACEVLHRLGRLDPEWRNQLADYFVFDALIGNTDRHQDNWGFGFSFAAGMPRFARLVPAFDNGTSLGYEMQLARVENFTEDQWSAYLRRGYHHVRRSKGADQYKHLETLSFVRDTLKVDVIPILARLEHFSIDVVREQMDLIRTYDLPQPLSAGRQQWIASLLTRRRSALLESLS